MPSVTPQELVKAIVAADGNLAVVSERLRLQQDIELSEQEILQQVSNTDGTTLGEVLRVGAIVKLYNIMAMTQSKLEGKLGSLSGSDLSRMHTAQMQALANLTSRPTEDAVDEPVSISAARQAMIDRIEQHEEREDHKTGSS